MAKSIIRLDHQFKDLVSVKYNDGDAYAAIQNGRVLKLDGLISGEREVFKGIAPTAITDDIVIVAGVELNSDESSLTKARLDEYENKADVPFRAINPKNSIGKIFSVSDDALVKLGAASVKGNYLIIKANTVTLEEKNALGGTESFVGLIVDKETVSGTVMAVVKIIKA
jgi:hypothetical protein